MATIAGIIFVVMYMVIVSEKIHRTVAAMIGAVLMMLLGILSQETALHHVDFETLGLLVGMMVLVGVTKETGLFDYVAIKAAKSAKAEPRRILVYLCLITALFSAFLDNVTTVLLMVPVTFSITSILRLDPMPYLLTQIIASNIGGTATLIGDPPNIMIGSAVKELTFVMFIEHLAPIAVICMLAVLFIMERIYHKDLVTTPERREKLMRMDEKTAIRDHALLKRALFVLGLEGSDDVRPLYFLAEVILPSEVLEPHRIAPVTELGLDPRSTSLVPFASWSAYAECYLLSDVS